MECTLCTTRSRIITWCAALCIAGMVGVALRPSEPVDEGPIPGLAPDPPEYPAAAVPKMVWAMWFGPPPTGARLSAARTIEKVGVPVRWLDDSNWRDVEAPAHRFPPALFLSGLSQIHRSDYLRAYIMHTYGGGYTDVKHTTTSWAPAWAEFDNASVWVVSVQEEFRRAVACGEPNFTIVPAPCDQVMNAWRYLGRNQLYIMRPNTTLTASWLQEATRRLNRHWSEIRLHPAHRPRCCQGENPNNYPVRWAEFAGEILHPLMAIYRTHLRLVLPAQLKIEYRGPE